MSLLQQLLLLSLVSQVFGEQLTSVQSRLDNAIYLYPNQMDPISLLYSFFLIVLSIRHCLKPLLSASSYPLFPDDYNKEKRMIYQLVETNGYTGCLIDNVMRKKELRRLMGSMYRGKEVEIGRLKRESDLPECGKFEVCSTVHKRPWLPRWVHRYCRCPASDCSENISSLDNKSTLKVCKGVVEQLGECSESEWGLEVRKLEGERRQVKISCRCGWPKYWGLTVHVENSTISHSRYACQSLRRCESEEFCGHVRADIFSTYLQCWCPPEHICITRDKQERNVTEALYQGPALRAYCQPLPEDITHHSQIESSL